jgi:hypothetical protein
MISLVLIGMHFDRVAVNDKNEKTTTTTQNRSERQQSTRKFQEEDDFFMQSIDVNIKVSC